MQKQVTTRNEVQFCVSMLVSRKQFLSPFHKSLEIVNIQHYGYTKCINFWNKIVLIKTISLFRVFFGLFYVIWKPRTHIFSPKDIVYFCIYLNDNLPSPQTCRFSTVQKIKIYDLNHNGTTFLHFNIPSFYHVLEKIIISLLLKSLPPGDYDRIAFSTIKSIWIFATNQCSMIFTWMEKGGISLLQTLYKLIAYCVHVNWRFSSNLCLYY